MHEWISHDFLLSKLPLWPTYTLFPANCDETEMVGPHRRRAAISQFLLQAAKPCGVGFVPDRCQLGTGVAAAHDIEPVPQILLIIHVSSSHRDRQKTGCVHYRDDLLWRPEVSQINAACFGEIFVIEPILRFLRTEAVEHEAAAGAENPERLPQHGFLAAYVMKRVLTGNEIEAI